MSIKPRHLSPFETTIRTKRGHTPKAPPDFRMAAAVRNILRVYDELSTPEHRAHGRVWYIEARHQCQRIADATGIPVEGVIGVMAALSPANKWARNVADCASMCHAYALGGRGAASEVVVCTYKPNKVKALDILAISHLGTYQSRHGIVNECRTILYGKAGRKLRSFYQCILDGQREERGHNQTEVCIDGHAWGIAHADRKSMQDVPSMSASRYAALQVAYKRAAEKREVSAPVMQAITWVAWRDHHNV